MMGFISSFTWKKSIVKFGDDCRRVASFPWFQGVLLLCCVVAAMLLANLPWTRGLYHDLLEAQVQIRFLSGGADILFPKDMTVEKLINDILMVVFFFTVGLEIRREIARGELSSPKKAMLPVIAAFGGVLAPACIYTLINSGTAAAGGWGIPTATDIAFVVCILTMLGDKVPVSIKVFLTALAIADDLIAILVVAIFYGSSINLTLLGVSLVVILIALMLKKLGEKHMAPYLLCAVLVWVLFYYSGVHATMSGVVMAFLIPAEPRYTKYQYIRKRDRLLAKLTRFDGQDPADFPNAKQKECLRRLEGVANGSMDMSYRVEHALTPWVNYLIMPIFALANAGVVISDASYFNIFKFDPALGSVSMGIFLGLQARGDHPLQLDSDKTRARRNADRRQLGQALRRRLPRGYRLHDVDFRGHALFRGQQPGNHDATQKRRKDCHPSGFRKRRYPRQHHGQHSLHRRQEAAEIENCARCLQAQSFLLSLQSETKPL